MYIVSVVSIVILVFRTNKVMLGIYIKYITSYQFLSTFYSIVISSTYTLEETSLVSRTSSADKISREKDK
jgi:hypothetical protein